MNPFVYGRITHWVKVFAVTGSTQIIIQVAGIASSIFIIRNLSIKEYAYYTIANTILGTMTLLSDGGISDGVMAQGGKKWQDQNELGVVLITGLKLRKEFALVTLLISIPILFYLLLHQKASWITCFLIASALIPAFIANLSDSLLEVAPKLHQNIKPLQSNQFIVAIGRFLLNTILLSVFPLAFVGLYANMVPRVYGNIKLKGIAKKFANLNQLPSVIERKAILTITKKILPLTIFICFSSQITLWVLSIFGNTDSIAQIGALGRLTIITSFISTVLSILIFPRFARIQSGEKARIIKFFTFIQVSLILLSGIIVLSAWIISPYLLSLLGKEYMNLSKEFMLSIVASCLVLLESTTGSLLNSRGWIFNPFVTILINISSLVVSIYMFNLTTLVGLLNYNILMNSFFYFILLIFSYVSLTKIEDKVLFKCLHKKDER